MNPISKHKLLTAEQHHYRTQYPSVPGHCLAKSKYTDLTTNGLTKCIIDYIRFTGGFVERINTTGRQIKAKSGKQIWIPTSGVRGSADLSCIIHGLAVRIEVKCAATHDRIRPDQVRYAERVQRAGAIYYIAWDFDSFLVWYESVMVPDPVEK